MTLLALGSELDRVAPSSEILFFRELTWLRRLGRPGPENILSAPERRALLDVVTRKSFITLADDDPREIVVGTVVAAPPHSTRPTTRAEFLAMQGRAGYALATMNFVVTPRADGTCDVSTETRVFATDRSARRRFAAYWRLINLGSAFIRLMWLRAIRRRAEAGTS